MNDNTFSIYQLKDTDDTRPLRFEPLERLLAAGGRIDRANYDLVYAGHLDPGAERQPIFQTLNALYEKFNMEHPLDYGGRSLSVSDIVVLRFEDMRWANYVDRFGFSEVPEFLDGPYRYYSTQRPVAPGTFPKTEGGPEQIENYERCGPVESGGFQAWGHLDYAAPLSQQDVAGYELRAAFDNPDVFRVPPCQLDARLQAVGRWEQAGHIPEADRLTEQQPDSGRFVLQDPAKSWIVNMRFKRIVANQGRRSIADQLVEGAKRSAGQELHSKNASTKSREDR